MKKLITLLLVLALTVPMCLVANAEVAAKPFYGLGWSDFDRDKFSNMEGCATLTFGHIGDVIHLSYGGAKVTAGSIDDAQVEKLATALKKEMDKRPEGMRYVHYFGPGTALGLAPEDAVYLDHGVDQMKEINEALFKKYAEIGGKIEGAIMANLYTGMSAYYINTNDAKKDGKIYGKIVKDPRYATEIRPLLVERGFTFYDGNITDYTPEIYGISGKAGAKYSNCQAIWNAVMGNRLNAYTTEWCYAPMAKYFPDVYVSDYQNPDNDAWLKAVNNDGGVMGSGGNAFTAGNTSCENFYAGRPTNEFYKTSGAPVFKNIPTAMRATYTKTPFHCFLYDMNVAKRVYQSSDNGNVCYWVSRYDGSKDPTDITNSPYYSEEVYHLNLLDPKPFVVFQNREGMTPEQIDLCTQVPSELLEELTRVAGYADRKPIAVPMNWNQDFVISGMYANGRNIWRITPNLSVISKEDFKVKAATPTFSVSGQTISFSGGHIIEDTEISEIGTCGYWVETDKTVTPVIVNDADRFEKYPAYLEDYESYAADSKLLSTNLRDLGGWTVQPKGSDLLIVSDGKDKALSITGNSLLENKLIPANVTVGDEYAKKQAWEVTITVPAGINADAKMTLLNYEGDMEDTDGGFLLKGSKLYYGTGEMDAEFEPVYKELMELKPGTYKLKRDLNFGQTFYCDYSVSDASGKVLTSAQKVKIPTFAGKVQTVGIKCDNMNQRVILDDYTLRATSAAADLYLYDTALGMKLDNNAKQTKSTTYRLSWANASKQEQTVTVKADITSGGKTTTKSLKTVKLFPGHDGVEYGTVEVKSGESVKIYLDSSIKDEKVDLDKPTAPTEQTTATQATEATKAPTTATKKPTKATATKPVSIIVTKATKATQATAEATKTPTKATKAPTQATLVTEAPTELTAITEATEVTAATALTAATESTDATAATETQSTVATTPETPKETKGGLSVGAIIAIVVVVLAAAGAGAYFFLIKKKK